MGHLDELAAEMRAHTADPFPDSVEKGEDHGEVEPVMIDADIFGWASRVSSGVVLSPLDQSRLQKAADELERSITTFPLEAQPYYKRVLRIARLALAD